jgi:hypothetical protein
MKIRIQRRRERRAQVLSSEIHLLGLAAEALGQKRFVTRARGE